MAGKNNPKGNQPAQADKKKAEEKENFQYIVRIANRDLDGEKKVYLALADLKGIGQRLGIMICRHLGIDEDAKIGELPEETVDRLREYVESKEYEGMPVWALNHRKEIVTGLDLNLVSNDLEVQVNDDINLMKKMRSYKGIRHEQGKKVRGQRTRSNGRKGLAIGVIRKKD